MTIITPNSITGINSITAQSNSIAFYSSDGTSGNLSVSGIVLSTLNPLIVGGGTSTGTSSQALQVNSGAYVSGNLGIGTTNPTQTLQVNSGTSSFVVTGIGSVGIGTTRPTTNLMVRVDQDDETSIRVNNNTDGVSAYSAVIAGNALGGFIFQMNASSRTNTRFGSSIGGFAEIYTSGTFTGSGIKFGTITAHPIIIGTNNTEAMRINSSQQVGIGTTNPGSGIKLDVVGGEIRAGRVDSASEGGQVSFSRSTDNATAWYLDVYGNTSTPSLRFVDVSNSAVRATIDGSGNFGMGVTPTAVIHIKAGTATSSTAPLKIDSGTVLTTPEADAFEYDGKLLYHTQNDTTNGNKRALIPEVQYQRRTSQVSITATATPGTSIFGNTSRAALLAGNIYEVEAVVWLTKVTNAGTATLQLSLSTGNFTFASAQLNTSAATMVLNGTTSPVSLPATTSLTAGTTYGVILRGIVQPVSNARLDILLFGSTTSITVESSTFMKVTCLGTASTIGNFA